MCGKRWMMNKNTNGLGAWLEKLEEDQARKYATFS